jgi:hypothetical protein
MKSRYERAKWLRDQLNSEKKEVVNKIEEMTMGGTNNLLAGNDLLFKIQPKNYHKKKNKAIVFDIK